MGPDAPHGSDAPALIHPRSTLALMASSRASEALQFDFPPTDDGEAETEGVAAEGNGPREERQPTRWEDEAEEWQADDLDGFEAGSSADSALTVAEFYDRVKPALRMPSSRLRSG